MIKKIAFKSILPLLTVGVLATCSSSFAGTCRDVFSTDIPTLLAVQKFNGHEIMERLALDPELKPLFDADNGSVQPLTIREHTRLVFDVFREQFENFRARFDFVSRPDIRVFETLQITIALHDIGKPLAIRAGDKNRQHEFTFPILEKQMRKHGFTEAEIALGKAILGHDEIGHLVQNKLSPEQTLRLLQDQAARLDMTLSEFLPLRLLFYAADAGAYQSLRAHVFRTEGGILLPNRASFTEFMKLAYPNDRLGASPLL